MKYIVVGWHDEFEPMEFDDYSSLVSKLESMGIPLTGKENSMHVRAELVGQPKFRGLYGPMWDGGRVRYETPRANKHLST